MAADFQNLRYERDGAVVTITIARPKVLNALDPATLDELDQALDRLAKEEGVAGAILTGDGEKSFVAGADLKHLNSVTDTSRARAEARRGQSVLAKLEQSPRPVIACVNGFALGGGLELALACHFRYATKNAKVGLPEVTLGLIPGYGGTQRLTRAIGRGPATELIVTGEQLTAEDAHRLGLVNKVFEDKPAMLEAAKGKLGKLAKNGPLAVALALEAIDRGLAEGQPTGLEIEADLFGVSLSSQDAHEGIGAFLEKRKPNFKGS